MEYLKKILLIFLLTTSISTCCLGEQKEDVDAPEGQETPESTELPEEANAEEFNVEEACQLFEEELARINEEIPDLEGQEKEAAIKRAEVLQLLIITISELRGNTTAWEERLVTIKTASWIAAGIGCAVLIGGILASGILMIKVLCILKWIKRNKAAEQLHVDKVEDACDESKYEKYSDQEQDYSE